LQSQLAELYGNESWIELGDLLNIWHQHQAPLLAEEKQDLYLLIEEMKNAFLKPEIEHLVKTY
jgi:hypothetical protein